MGQKCPFPSDLATHEIVHSEEKNSNAVTQIVTKATKPRLSTIAITITGTSKSWQSHRKLNVISVTKFFPKSNI